jgi:hypothetical protein
MVLISARIVQVFTVITEKKLIDKKLEVHHEEDNIKMGHRKLRCGNGRLM